MAENDLPWFSTMGSLDSPEGSLAESEALQACPEFPGYEVLRLLGRGGMGEVYLARDLQLGRLVAIKSILGSADPRRLERFRDEAHAIARLSHPNIAKVHAFGSVRGIPYLVMEYVGGGTLADLSAERLSDPRSAARLAITIARAVAEAHSQGIIHRDLKPGNLLLAEEKTAPGDDTVTNRKPPSRGHDHLFDWSTRIRVADFGLAKQIDDSQQRTRTGEILGTPSYMAPEQASGVVRQIGPAADIHAIGAILYECVTGRPPYLGGDALQTLTLLLTSDPVSPKVLQPKLSRDLETIILKCLARQPRNRYASCEALIDDLERWLDGKAIHARRTPVWIRGARWIRRHPAISSVAFFFLLTVTSILVLQQRAADRLQRSNQRASLLLDVVNESIPQLETLDAAERRSIEQAQWTIAARSLDELAAQVPSGDPLRFQAEQIRIKYLMGLVLNAELGANLPEQRRLLDEIDSSLEGLESTTESGIERIDFQLWGWRMISVHWDRLGDYERAVEKIKKGLAVHQAFIERHPDLAAVLLSARLQLLNSLGVSYSHLATLAHLDENQDQISHYQELAGQAFQEHLALVRSETAVHLPNRDQLIADSANNLGTWYGNQQQRAEAIAQLELALEYYERLAQANSSMALQADIARTLNNLFVFRDEPGLSMLEHAGDAEKLKEVVDRIEPIISVSPATVDLPIIGNYFVARYLNERGEYDQAVERLDRGLRWCGYVLARSETNESILVMAETLETLRKEILTGRGRADQLPRFEVDEKDPVAAAERGFVLAMLGLDEPLQSWLIEYRQQWNDPLSQELAERVEALSRAMQKGLP